MTMRSDVTANYIEGIYKGRVENLLRDVMKEFREEYPLFLKIRAYYIKKQASNSTIYTRLTRLRSVCRASRELFGKPLTKLTREEWDALSAYLYNVHNTRDAIISAIHPLRLALKFLGYDEETIKELFPYPSSIKARLQHNAPPPYVPGHVLDKVIFAINEDVYRALFCLMRITEARIEEITLLRRENIINDEDAVYVRFDVTKNGLPREIPLNWPEFEQHLRVFLTWYYHQHPRVDDPEAWLFPRQTDASRPVPRHFTYLVLKRAAKKLAKSDPEVRKYLDYIHQHQFRHTRAYELVFQNWNVRWIMYYFGWRKIDMVLRYTQAFELKQVYRMMNSGKSDEKIKSCPRCHALVPQNAKYCPYCGLRLTEHDMGELLRVKKDKEQLKKQLLRLIEELGVESLKELLISH